MRTAFICLLSGALLLLTGAFALPPTAQAREPGTLTIGMFAYRPVSVLEPAWRPLAWYLQDKLPGQHVNIRFLGQDEMARALQNDELDLVFTNPSHYIGLRTGNALSGAIATLVALENGKPVSQLGGVLIRHRKRTDIDSWQDLRGKTVAVTGTQYLGGYAAQAHELTQRGIALGEIEFLRLGNPHDRIIQAVLKGRADAGFIRTGVLESLQLAGDTQVEQLEVVEAVTHPGFPYRTSTALYPEWAIVALPHLDRDLSRRISAALLAIEPDDVVSELAGIHGFSIPSDYQPVQAAMVSARIPPFDRAPAVSLREFAGQHAVSVAALVFTFITLGLATFWVLRSNRRLRNAQARLEDEHQRLEQILEGTGAGTWEWDIADGRLSCGGRWAAMLGYTLDELSPITLETWQSLTHPADRQRVLDGLRARLDAECGSFEDEFRMRHRDGHWVWVHSLSKVVLRSADGKPLRLSGIHLDVSERKRNEEERALSHSVFLHTHTGVIVTDATNRIVQVNPAFTRITGYTREDALGQSPSLLSTTRQEDSVSEQSHVSWQRSDAWDGEFISRHKDGHEFTARLTLRIERNADGEIAHRIAVFTDTTLEKQLLSELQHSAHHDLLTGLPNRTLLHDRLSVALAQAPRAKTSLAVIFVDLDGFKPINDTHGHMAGDELLRTVAHRIRHVVRDGDTVARIGGDEFVIVVNGVVQQADAVTCATRVLAAISAPVALACSGATVQVSGSLGVLVCGPDACALDETNAEQLLGQADALMYRAKRSGKARCVVERYPLDDAADQTQR